MKNFYVHFCQEDKILRRYDVSIIHSKEIDLNCYSNLISTKKGILTMQKMFRDYLYNTFAKYNPYPNWGPMTVNLTSSIKEFLDNNVLQMSFFTVDNENFLYGFKSSIFNNTVTLYVLSV